MTDQPTLQTDGSPGAPGTLSGIDLASRAGTTPERIAALARGDALQPVGPDRYRPGDIHRVRALDAFESAGVPLEALAAASAAGRVSFAYYEELHQPPGLPSEQDYAGFLGSLGELANLVPALFRAFGLAEPGPEDRLAVEEEAFIADLAEAVHETERPEVAIRVVRAFAEATRRAARAALGAYAEVVAQFAADKPDLTPEVEYERVFKPWARIARGSPDLAAWLTSRHLSLAIDAYSVDATERILESSGFIPERREDHPGVAFVDLTGFSRMSEERGDEVAAHLSLHLGDLARDVAEARGGRVVKLLGDGVLLQFPDAAAALAGTLDLMRALPDAGLPPGHAGVHSGPLIERDGDIFGRSVNLASRISDVAPSGETYVSEAIVRGCGLVADAFESVGAIALQGIGDVQLHRVVAGIWGGLRGSNP